MNEHRQRRVTHALATGLVTLGVMGLSSGCEVRASIDTVQTAVAVVQTVVPGVQTALPAWQATAQAGSTAIAGVLGDPQTIATQLQALLAGVSVDLKTAPSDAANDAVTRVSITATDVRGSFSQLDATARQASAGAALLVVSQYYPNATVSLWLVDTAGQPLLGGTKEPGRAPSIQ